MKRIPLGSLVNSLVATLFLVLVAWSRGASPQDPKTSTRQSEPGAQVTVPSRPATPLYKGEQGLQRSEVAFAPVSRTVTIKLHVEDPNGYFLPNLRRENFAVYEDGVRQKNVTVEVEHAPVSVALLMEFGGRCHELNEAIGREVYQVGRQLLDVLGREDKIAVFKYGDRLDTVVGFDQGHEVIEGIRNTRGQCTVCAHRLE